MFSREEPKQDPLSGAVAPKLPPEAHARELLRDAAGRFSRLETPQGLAAVRHAVEAIDHASFSSDYSRQWVRLEAARLLAQYEQLEEAEEQVNSAIQIASTSGALGSLQLASMKIFRAELQQGLGRLGDAEQSVTSALSGFEGERHHPLALSANLTLANIKLDQGNQEQYGALMCAAFSELSAAAAANPQEVFELLEDAACQRADEGKFEQALILAQESLSIYRGSPEIPAESIQLLRAQIGTFLHKLGRFEQARDIRAAVLREREANCSGGTSRDAALQAKFELAETLLELNDFERAEGLLHKAMATAQELQKPRFAMKCADLLCVEYLDRGMHDEVRELRTRTAEFEPQLSAGNRLINETEGELLELARRGSPEEALARIDERLVQAEALPEGEGRFVRLCLLVTKALVVVRESADTAREILDEIFDQSLSLPASFQDSLQARMAAVEVAIAREQNDPERSIEVALKQLRVLEKAEGEGRSSTRITIMQWLAISQNAADRPEEAIETLRKVVVLHERHNDTQSLPFAKSLMLLADFLPDEDPEAASLRERALPILERYTTHEDDEL